MPPSRSTYRVEVLGCRTNQYEGQAFRDQMRAKGWREAAPGETAEVCIVNTCTVTHHADSSSRHTIRQLARQNPESRLIVTGCLAERDPEAIAAIPGVSHVVPNKEKESLLQTIFADETWPEFAITHFEAHTRAFVKVQDGCNSFCTYCIIPYVRGRSHSRSIDEVVREVEQLIANGYKEVVLTGINIGDFDGGGRLAQLVRTVDQVPGLQRLRVSSIDPDEVDDELEAAILGGRTTCPSMHIVLQSGSNAILKRMNRKYTRQVFMETIRRLQAACSDFTATTDIIVGFPGETERDFEDTLEVMREVQFAKVHIFPYSDRPRTRAALYPNKVPPEVMAARKAAAQRVAEEAAWKLRERFVGREMEVLVEEGGRGHTTNFLEVQLAGEPNAVRRVQLTHNSAAGLVGV